MGGVVSLFKRLFSGSPDEYNATNANIEKYHEMRAQALEMKEKAEKDAADAQMRVEESAQREAEAKKGKRRLS